MDTFVKLENITKIYHMGEVEIRAVDGIDFSIQKGEFVVIVGPSGAGKTTVLNILGGMDTASGGRITVDGQDITKQKEYKRLEKIGRVYQNPAMGTCPSMTILENMAMADNKGKAFGLKRGTDKKRIAFYKEELAKLQLGLEDKLNTKVGALSGGQRQALALLMSTMTPIDFLILDEHTAALDPKTADLIMELTEKIVREKHLTAIMVTHNLRYAVEYGDRLLMLHQGNAVMDAEAEKKKEIKIEDILEKFNEISIECGN